MNPLSRLAAKIAARVGDPFPGSRRYWDRRYAAGGNSGSGSYGRLAKFKATVLNSFVAENGITSVIEFGCGDGNQLALASYPSYYGVDVSEQALQTCRQRFNHDETRKFGLEPESSAGKADLSMSLDVIYHLVEDATFHQYMEALFRASRKWVVVYSSNLTEQEFKRAYPTQQASHVRHRRFTNWVAQHAPQWELMRRLENPYPYDVSNPEQTSFADFYFYGLAGSR
jgi:SAM-dependent methyltransferase